MAETIEEKATSSEVIGPKFVNPNDFLLLFLAAIEYPAKKMNGVIILGDLTFALMVAILASKGIMLFI